MFFQKYRAGVHYVKEVKLASSQSILNRHGAGYYKCQPALNTHLNDYRTCPVINMI